MKESKQPYASTTCHIRLTHPDGFRSGQWGVITGVRMVVPRKGDRSRPCYAVAYPGVVMDFIPLEDSNNFEIGDPLLLEEAA